MPPIMEDMSLDIMEEEEVLENEEEFMEDMLEDMPPIPMSMSPIFDIILLIMSSIPRDFMSPPIILGIPMPPMLIMLPGMGPPEDIMVEEEDEEELDLKLEMVEPSPHHT